MYAIECEQFQALTHTFHIYAQGRVSVLHVFAQTQFMTFYNTLQSLVMY